jgi:hypothetical protein
MSHSRHRTIATVVRQAGTLVAAGACGLALSGPAAGASTGNGSTSGSAPALCPASAVHIRATTNHPTYVSGQKVVLRSSVTNVSSAPCSVWLGLDPGFSPSFVVGNAKGHEVWERCDINDEPGACFDILVAHRLNPGRSYHEKATWDQGSARGNHAPKPVHPGTYTFVTHYQNIVGIASRQFTITKATHP